MKVDNINVVNRIYNSMLSAAALTIIVKSSASQVTKLDWLALTSAYLDVYLRLSVPNVCRC